MTLRVLDLFSGIGGFSLGLERAGMQTVAFCEIEPYCRAVLAKHWPGVPIHGDIRRLRGAGVGPVDVICAGFPCQDVSLATKGGGKGLKGARSGLWSECTRIVSEIKPSWVILENSPALRSRGLEQVLGELTALGYDAEWHCIPASAVGAPHQRDRIWVIAYREGRPYPVLADVWSNYDRWTDGPWRWDWKQDQAEAGWLGEDGYWWIEPGVARILHGIPNATHRIRALGNAVVPQISEIIGRAILKAEEMYGQEKV
jgi:DNA (cytosine-5)-methyltransferase 1